MPNAARRRISGRVVDISPRYPEAGNIPAREGNGRHRQRIRAYIDAGIDLWRRGAIDALVTGPVSKGFIEKTGLQLYRSNRIHRLLHR